MTLRRGIALDADDGFRLPELADDGVRVASRSEARYVTTYVDSPDHRLRRWGVTLRHRTDEGWTVELPADGDGAETEAHVFTGDRPTLVPREALDLVAAYLRRARPSPVVALRTERRSVSLVDDRGEPVAMVTDDAVVIDEPPRPRRRFFRRLRRRRAGRRVREIAVAVAEGADEERADAIVARLVAAGAGPVVDTPAVERILGDAGPREVVVEEIAGDATVERVVRAAIARSVARLIDHDPGVRLGIDPEAVHQARVATRRLRSDLRTFRNVLDEGWAEALRRDLKALGGALGEVRDADVLLERLRSREPLLGPNDGRAVDLLLSILVERRRAARARLLRLMRDRRYLTLLDRLVEAARSPRVRRDVRDASAREELARVMRRPWKRVRRAVAEAEALQTNGAFHAARIRVKRARYAADAIAPIFGKRAERFSSAAADLQDLLGEHQDAVVADAFLRASGGRSIAEAFVAGELAALEGEARRAARVSWRPSWETLEDRRLRFWT